MHRDVSASAASFMVQNSWACLACNSVLTRFAGGCAAASLPDGEVRAALAGSKTLASADRAFARFVPAASAADSHESA